MRDLIWRHQLLCEAVIWWYEEIAVSTVYNINLFLDHSYIKIRVKRLSDLYIVRFSSFRYRLYHLVHFGVTLNYSN